MHRRTVTGIILASFLAFAAASVAQAQTATKPRLAVQSITATPAVMARAAGDGSGVKNVLEQILQAADSDLVDSLHKSGRFEVVAAGDIQSVLAAQDVQNSGLYDTSDPQTAHAFKLAGFKYIATVTVTSFQLIDRAAVIPDAMGNSTYTYETIQLGATLK
ncbi:MAG: CsgG/HfaB family protein, partial [Phycisphaerales bacterium]|nr:CsgG/HfaB family protein [Phycisphaerales bacterium]